MTIDPNQPAIIWCGKIIANMTRDEAIEALHHAIRIIDTWRVSAVDMSNAMQRMAARQEDRQ